MRRNKKGQIVADNLTAEQRIKQAYETGKHYAKNHEKPVNVGYDSQIYDAFLHCYLSWYLWDNFLAGANEVWSSK